MMQREIKFRVWDKWEKCMHEIYQFQGIFMSPNWDRLMAFAKSEEAAEAVFDQLPDDDRSIKDVVIMQFTGLQDKHGKDIYEDDVVKCCKKDGFIKEGACEFSEAYAIAVIRNNGWRFYFDEIRSDDPRGWFFNGPESESFFPEWNKDHTIEILGSLHEHPELLEGGE